MKIRQRRQTTLVKVLTDADAEWVSLVDHGANQTPFRLVKRVVDQIEQLAEKAETGESSMNLRKKNGDGVRTTAVVGIELKSKVFKTEEAARDYLKGDFESYELKKISEGWEVANPDFTADQFASIREVNIANGVIARVGTFKADATKEPKVPAAKAEAKIVAASADGAFYKEMLAKYDSWSAYLSGGSSVEEVMKAGLETSPVPPGFYEVFDAMYIAMDNKLKAGDVEGLEEVMASGGRIIGKLSQLFTALVGADKKDTAKKMAVKKEVILDDKAHEAEQAAEAAKTEPAAEPVESDLQTFAKQVTEQLTALSSTVTDQFTGLQATITEQKTAVETLTASVAKATTDLESVAARVAALETSSATVQKSEPSELESMTASQPSKGVEISNAEKRRRADLRKSLGL